MNNDVIRKQYSVMLDSELHSKLKKLAFKENRSISYYIEKGIKKILEDQKDVDENG